jgi:hypothetical protein
VGLVRHRRPHYASRIAVLKVGPRTQPTAYAVVHGLVKVLPPNCLPVFTSDGLRVRVYFYALTAHFGSWAEAVGKQTRQWQVHAQPPQASMDKSSNITAAGVSSASSAMPCWAHSIN